MIDVSVTGLIKSFEVGNNIIDGLTFNINNGEHVGILGHNGCGKTTLFKILTGDLDFDEGEVVIASGKKLGLISQIPVYPDGWTTEDVLKEAHREVTAIAKKLNSIADMMVHDSSPELLEEYDTLTANFERLGGYDIETETNRVANGLDITPEMRKQAFDTLSGGERTRVNLARLILEDTDILLLDEPTNHLDLHATEWLEEYIQRFKGTVLSISHDRYFLDRTAQRCIEIVDGKAEFYSGGYSFFLEERQRRFEEKLRRYEKDQAKIEQLTRAAEQMHLWAFMGNDKLHKRAFSMEKRIEKLQSSEKPKEEKRLHAKIGQREFNGDEVIVTENISKAYGTKKLFSGLSFTVKGNERIALIGDNGTGKTTFIKMLTGEVAPDSGYLYRGPSVRTAYLPQIVKFNQETRSALDTMLYDCNCMPQDARDRLAAYGFRGEDVLKPVGTLSGGEKSRLRLCMLLGTEINLLILDEPTNHLDIASREWIEDALSDYQQTLLFVSHDRYFIEKFATRIWALENGTITDYKGTYAEYTAWKARQAVFTQAEREKARVKKNKPKKDSSPAKQIAKLEKEISKCEEQLAILEQKLIDNASNYTILVGLEEEKLALEETLLELYEKQEEMTL